MQTRCTQGSRGRSRLTAIVLLLVTLDTSCAFFLKPKPRMQAASQPIDADCEAKARLGDCAFYACFNERHGCDARNNYAINYGWKFCTRFDANINELNNEGRHWLNGTRRCSMEAMLDFYREEAISCSEVERYMKERHAACEVENGLCRERMLIENKDVFSDVYSLNSQSASQFLYTVKKCTLSKVSEFTTWFSDKLHVVGEAGSSVVPYIEDLEDKVAKWKVNLEAEFSRLRNSIKQFGNLFRNTESDDEDDD